MGLLTPAPILVTQGLYRHKSLIGRQQLIEQYCLLRLQLIAIAKQQPASRLEHDAAKAWKQIGEHLLQDVQAAAQQAREDA